MTHPFVELWSRRKNFIGTGPNPTQVRAYWNARIASAISRRSHMTKLFPFARLLTVGSGAAAVTLCVCLQVQTSAQPARSAPVAVTPASSPRRLVDRYCVTCHNERLKTADLRLDRLDLDNPATEAEAWEKVVRKVHTGTMPPPNMPQPSQDDRRVLLTWLETSLDA